MFAYLRGTLEEVYQDKVVLDINGVGYLVTVPSGVMQQLPSKGSVLKLYTYFVVREDAHELYGFVDLHQKKMFERLITVTGIGPKGGLSILSMLTTEEIVAAVRLEDIKTLTKAPGVGKKTAQRIIFELKDKLDDFDVTVKGDITPSIDGIGGEKEEAVEALQALGYTHDEAVSAVASIEDVEGDASNIIKAALKNLDR